MNPHEVTPSSNFCSADGMSNMKPKTLIKIQPPNGSYGGAHIRKPQRGCKKDSRGRQLSNKSES